MKTFQKYILVFLILILFPADVFSQQTAEDFYRQGIELSKKGKYDAAIAAMDEAVKLKSDYAEAYLERSRFKQNNQRDLKGAFADIETVLQINPRLGEAYFERSRIRSSQFIELLGVRKTMSGEESLPYQKLILEDVNLAINYGYKNKRSFETRADLYERTFGDHRKAIEDFTAALGYDSDDTGILNNRALAKKNNRDMSGAIADLREIHNIYERRMRDKEYPAIKLQALKSAATIALNNLSSVYAESGDFPSQLWAIEKSIELEPTATGYAALGRYKTIFGELDEAIADYNKAIELWHGSPGFGFLDRGIAYYLQGKLAEAQADFNKVIEANPRMKNSIDYKIEVTRRQREQKRVRVELP